MSGSNSCGAMTSPSHTFHLFFVRKATYPASLGNLADDAFTCACRYSQWRLPTSMSLFSWCSEIYNFSTSWECMRGRGCIYQSSSWKIFFAVIRQLKTEVRKHFKRKFVSNRFATTAPCMACTEQNILFSRCFRRAMCQRAHLKAHFGCLLVCTRAWSTTAKAMHFTFVAAFPHPRRLPFQLNDILVHCMHARSYKIKYIISQKHKFIWFMFSSFQQL